MPMRVTAITHRKKPVIPSYISQVAPSESSVIKRVAYEPLFLAHLRDTLGIRGVKRVNLHEPLTGLLRVTHRHGREGHVAHRSLARAARRRLLQGRLRQDLHRGQRRHLRRQCRRAALGHGLSHEPGRGRADGAASRPGPRAQARARQRRGFDAADGRDHERRHAAAGAAEAGIHGARARRSGTSSASSRCARSRRGSAIRSATGCRNGTRRPSARRSAAISRTA